MASHDADRNDGILRLVRQTAEGLVDLVGKHLALARLELAGDLVGMARRARVIAVCVLFAIVGYVLGMAGLAVYLGGTHRVGAALAAVGLVHVVGGVGVLLAVTRARRTQVLDTTTDEVKRSLNTLGGASVAGGLEKTHAV